MGFDVTVVCSTYGSQDWVELARTRAVPSAEAQGVPVIHVHDDTLAASRNAGLERVETEWVVMLDADDELEPSYIAAMEKGIADVRGPLIRYMLGSFERNLWQPRVVGHVHDCTADCLPEGNWLCIGSAVRTNMLREVGGFQDYPIYEDWATWLRCYKAGASFELLPDAVYRAYVAPSSRNRGASAEVQRETYAAIQKDAA